MDDAQAAMKLVLARLEGKNAKVIEEEVISIGHSFFPQVHYIREMHSNAFLILGTRRGSSKVACT